MQNADHEGLSLEDLRKYPGFEDMDEDELKASLYFIKEMAEILHSL